MEKNKEKSQYPGCKLHEIGPYIGKIRPNLARQLLNEYSRSNQWVWDPFCGSGTIPLEAMLLDRHVIASDINPYACILTKAKLHAPQSELSCKLKVTTLANITRTIVKKNNSITPIWVRNFFHEKTLDETKALIIESLQRRWYFIAGCLLGILHHQRPGFLSYPASHLVPYLRDNLFPKDRYPEAYEYRDPIPRLNAKIKRILTPTPPSRTTRYRILQKSVLNKYLPSESIDVIITSPPYMNALDYARDNRLRLWFLGIEDFREIKKKEVGKISTFKSDMAKALQIMTDVLKPDGICILVVGDVARINKDYDVSNIILDIINNNDKTLTLENHWYDSIPDIRRSRRNCKTTRHEKVLIFRKIKKRGFYGYSN